MPPDYWKHPTAIVEENAKVGSGSKIWHFSHICGENVEIGCDCSFGQNTYIGPNVRIGNGVRVQNNVSIYDFVELEDYVFCGPSMVFTNVINPRAHVPRKSEYKKTTIRSGASLGANCTIVCGIEIGRFAFVAAGAVVTTNVEPFALVQGVPAKRVSWICHCGVKATVQIGEFKCPACASIYLAGPSELKPIKLNACFTET